MISRKGVTLIELLISMIMLSVISISLAEFMSQFTNASFINCQQLEKVNFTRFTVERVIDEIKKAEYIYPASVTIAITGKNINTDSAIALLIPVDKTKLIYRFTAFYFSDSGTNVNLMEMHSTNQYTWAKNAVPAETMNSITGTSQVIASNINSNNSQLSYTLNYNNGIADTALKGGISSTSVTSSKALISRVQWDIEVNKNGNEEITIYGNSNNVPRFIE